MKTRHAVVAVALAAGGLLPMEQVTSAPRPDPGAERTGNVFAKPQPGVPGSQRPTREAALAAAAAAPDAADTAGGRALMHNSLIDLVPCDDDPAFLCGTLRVRFDRRLPNGPRLNLHVEVFPHQGPAPQADGAVFVTEGGPGFSVSLFAKYDYAFFLLEDVAQTRDLVFVDQRGVGLSDVIDCPQWQHGGPFYRSAKRCHDQLGDVASRYSTTDVADDLNAVRKALNYKRIDLVGGSYAGTDMLTYTVRHKPHVRSVVLGAPVVLPGMDTFFPYTPEAFPHVVNGLCGRSPGCAAENPDPDGSLAWLAARLRRHPVSGTGIDSMGVPHEITVTENLLAFAMMAFTGPSFVGPGEIAQAAEALRNGDKTPLLRLAADVDPANGFDSGDPREYSNGHNLARLCVDAPLQWNKQAPLWRRLRQYVAAFRDAPDFFGPISKRGMGTSGVRRQAAGGVHRIEVGRPAELPRRHDRLRRFRIGDHRRVRPRRPDVPRPAGNRGAGRRRVRRHGCRRTRAVVVFGLWSRAGAAVHRDTKRGRHVLRRRAGGRLVDARKLPEDRRRGAAG